MIGKFINPIASAGTPESSWQRPADWLPLPTVTDTDQTFVGLHAVIENADNYAAFTFTTFGGQFRVDWGDGVIDLVNSGVNAEHQYNFATYDVTNTTLTTRGYKQAIIIVTPVSGNLLTANFQKRFTTVLAQESYSTGFLDCIVSMPNHTASAFVFGGLTVNHSYVEQFEVKTLAACTSLSNMFFLCSSLQSVPLFNTLNVTFMSAMFSNCQSLQSVPFFDTSNVLDMSNMFSSCSSLQEVPLFDTAKVTTMQSMFASCSSLRSVPLFNTIKVTTMQSMFQSCVRLQSIPLFNTEKVTNMNSMFSNISSLNFIPALSTVLVTSNDFNNFSGVSLNRCTVSFGTSVSFNPGQLSKTAIEEILTNLKPRITTSATVNFSNNWGRGTVFSKTGTLTDNSTLITIADTSSLLVGMQVTGTGSPLTSPVAVTLQDAGDTVTLISHGLQNGDEISFATRVTTTGFALNTIYYIINSTLDTFQISATLGGTALPLTSNGSGTIRHRTEILSIVLNTSVTMTRPMRGSGAQTLAFRELRTGTGLLKNWVVTA